MILKIKGYAQVYSSVESHFIFIMEINGISIEYNLKIPTNPLVECDLLKLHEKEINKVREVIINIISKKKYSNKTILKLLEFKTWIENVNNVDIGLQ